MGRRAQELSEKIQRFSDELIHFVDQLSDGEWNQLCEWEQWTVGMTARHLGAGHFAIYDMAGMIVDGKELPQLSMDQINEMSNADAHKHAGCTKAEVLEKLRTNSRKMVEFAAGLSDADLDRKGSMPAFEGEVTTEQFLEFVLLQSGRQHFDSMISAVAG